MTIDPSTLLIFKARGVVNKEKKGKKKSTQENVNAINALKRLGIFSPSKETEPMIIPKNLTGERIYKQEPISKPMQKASGQIINAQPVVREQKRQEVQKPKAMEEQNAAANAKERHMRFGLFDLSSAKQNDQGYNLGSSIYSQQELAYNREPEAFHEPPSNELMNIESTPHLKKPIPISQQQSREAASSKTCLWHPWRGAYAICKSCRRAFCFQDIIEFNKDYYCLEDIDNASSKPVFSAIQPSNRMATVSGLLMLAAVLTFFYFSHAQVLYILGYVHEIGLPFFIVNINYNYAFALLESIIMAIAFGSAIMLFVRPLSGFYVVVSVCLASAMLFSYQYTSTGTLYLGIVDVLIFGAFAALIFSITRYAPAQSEEINPLAALNKNVAWPNVGRF